MGRPLKLEVFDQPGSGDHAPIVSTNSAIEEGRLQSFEKGYAAGWDDSTKAHEEEQGRISAELANNLQSMSFTYHEARGAVLGELEGILRGMVAQVLPRTLVGSLGETIIQMISELGDDASRIGVDVVVSPENVDLVTSLVEGRVAPPLRIVAEDTLGAGQAFLRFGGSEHKIDLEAVLQELSDAVTEFFEHSGHQEAQHA